MINHQKQYRKIQGHDAINADQICFDENNILRVARNLRVILSRWVWWSVDADAEAIVGQVVDYDIRLEKFPISA